MIWSRWAFGQFDSGASDLSRQSSQVTPFSRRICTLPIETTVVIQRNVAQQNDAVLAQIRHASARFASRFPL